MDRVWPTGCVLIAVLLAGGCAPRYRVDRGPAPLLHRDQAARQGADWSGWGKQRPGAVDSEPPLDVESETPPASVLSMEQVERAIETFQHNRRGSGPALDSAWPPFIEIVDEYLDQAPEHLSLSPLIRARVAAEYELDRERRRPLGTPPELERIVLRLIIRIDRKMRAVRTLAATAPGAHRPVKASGLAWPLTRGVITSGFGSRRDPIIPGKIRFHAGIDLSAGVNEPIYAAASGRVVQAGWNGSAGRAVRIRHAGGVETFYGHLAMVMVKIGQRVEGGDVIGLLGSSGRATGPHLHFAVYRGGKPVDPLDQLREVPMSFSQDMPGIVFGWGN